jgi:uncharacterized metal-binding protein
MPSGIRHLQVELFLLPPFTIGFYFLTTDLKDTALFGVFYLLSSIFLSPDLDMKKSIPKRRWGPLGFIWFPYSLVFKHRGISHSLLWGPLTRLLYIGFLLALLSLPLIKLDDFSVNVEALSAVILGIYIPNVLHVLYDRLSSRMKRLF